MSFDENILARRSRSPDVINTGWIQIHHQLVRRLIVEFVVAVEDHFAVGVHYCHVRPIGLKVRGGIEDRAVGSPVVVGIKDSVHTGRGEVRDCVRESGKICGVCWILVSRV